MVKIILKKEWDRILVNPASRQTPLTKITKKIRDGIINTREPANSINNQLRLILFVFVNKYSYYLRCI